MKGQETINQKREKHKNMIIKAIEVKLLDNKLTLQQKEQLNTLFREAKWFKNYCIAQNNIFKIDTKIENIPVVKGDKIENEKLILLSGHMKQDLKAELITSIKMLSTKKKQGHKDKVGKLKFKSECNEIPLRQFGNTYTVDMEYKKVHITKVKGWIKVIGLNQLKNIEFDYANAQLLRKASGYYLHIIIWQYPPKTKSKKLNKNNIIGIDFGIGHNLTTIGEEVEKLHKDEEVGKGAKIYEYVLCKDQDPFAERLLNLRQFDERQKRIAYENQKGICPLCKKHFEIDEMEGDHIVPWSKGGETLQENCQMLCKNCNRHKSAK